MSTTPNPVTTPTLTGVSTFLKTHERIILVLIASIVIYGLYSHVLGYLADHDQAVSTKAQVVLQAQLQANQAALADEKQQLVQYQQLAQQVLQSNTALAAATQQRQQQTQVQQKTDSSLQPADLAARWSTLTKTVGVTPTLTGYSVTPTAALTTVQDLETIPQLSADLVASKQETSNETNLVAGLTKLNDGLNNQVGGLNQTLTDQTKSCNAQIITLKAQARKSKLHWFGAGVAVGYVGGLLTKF